MPNFEPFSRTNFEVHIGGQGKGPKLDARIYQDVIFPPQPTLQRSLTRFSPVSRSPAALPEGIIRIHPEYNPSAPEASTETTAEKIISPLISLAQRAIRYAEATRPER